MAKAWPIRCCIDGVLAGTGPTLFVSTQNMSFKSLLQSMYLRGYFAVRRVLGLSLFEKCKFLKAHRRWPPSAPAQTFTESILARKLGAADERFPVLADKVAVRSWVAQRIGPQHLIPALAVYDYDNLESIDVAPGQVIKCANRAGGVYFTSTEDLTSRAAFIKKIRKDLDFDFAAWTGENWYSRIPKRVIAEQALTGPDGGVPADYKFFVFNGVVKTIQLHMGRFAAHTLVIFDRDWQQLPLSMAKYGVPDELPARPAGLDRMLEIAEILGKDFDFIRVDLYETDDHAIYFGEMTIAPGSGLTRFQPVYYDWLLGQWWQQAASARQSSPALPSPGVITPAGSSPAGAVASKWPDATAEERDAKPHPRRSANA